MGSLAGLQLHVRRSALVFAVLAVLLSFSIVSYFQVAGYQYRWVRCIDHFLDGSLYGGQPECAQPPVVYAVGAVLSLISFGHLQAASTLLSIALNIMCLVFILSLVKSGRDEVNHTLSAMYCLVILPLTVGNLATLLAAAFMMSGYHILKSGMGVRRVAVASLLFMLSLASKVVALSGLAGILVVYFISHFSLSIGGRRGLDVSFEVDSSFFKNAAALLFPFLVAVLALKLLYPQIFVYTLFSHVHSEEMSYAQAARDIILTNPLAEGNTMIFYVLVLASILYYLRSRDPTALVYVIASATTFVSRYKPVATTSYLFASHYVIFPLFFLMIISGRYLNSLRKEDLRIQAAFIMLLAAVFYGEFHLYGQPPTRKMISLYTPYTRGLASDVALMEDRIDGVYFLIPPNTGWVLADREMRDLLSERTPNLDMSLVDSRNNPPEEERSIDLGFVPGLKHYNASEGTYSDSTALEEQLADEISSGKYGMIFISPKSYDTQIMHAFNILDRSVAGRYCVIYLPTFRDVKHVRHYTTLLFNDTRQCTDMLFRSKAYLESVFDDLCARDEWVANQMVWGTFARNNLQLDVKCDSGVDTLDRFREAKIADHLKIPVLLALMTAWVTVHMLSKYKFRFRDGKLIMES
ncbi:MAG: hypothetical protein GF416_06895 [Candidatus Altiarchaeales archaeon]|nr:hypothetical protein [Candidatus Altiarchaeales archaeon]MBD3416840.1 hypothetical protein [Candidatus Altiarchaeales archaeon]